MHKTSLISLLVVGLDFFSSFSTFGIVSEISTPLNFLSISFTDMSSLSLVMKKEGLENDILLLKEI